MSPVDIQVAHSEISRAMARLDRIERKARGRERELCSALRDVCRLHRAATDSNRPPSKAEAKTRLEYEHKLTTQWEPEADEKLTD